jgi:hypothetical protein
MSINSCFSGAKRLDRESNNSLHLVLTLRMHGALYLRSLILHGPMITHTDTTKHIIIPSYYYYCTIIILLFYRLTLCRKLLLQKLIVAQLANKSLSLPSAMEPEVLFLYPQETATVLFYLHFVYIIHYYSVYMYQAPILWNINYTQAHFPWCSFLNWNYSLGCLEDCSMLVLQSVRLILPGFPSLDYSGNLIIDSYLEQKWNKWNIFLDSIILATSYMIT